jgi:sugar-specific transcriptional regulator TrmB
MKKIIEYLEKLDFSKTEANLYIILLQKGSMTVSELAEKANINRTAAYGYINTLLDKGVIAKSTGVLNKVTANPPEQLHYLVDEKLSAAKILQEQLYPLVTDLNSIYLRSTLSNESEMKYFKGRAGIKAIYEDCLKSDNIKAYYNPKEINKLLPENLNMFNKKISENPKMKVYEIVEYSKEAEAQAVLSVPINRHYWKFLPSDVKLKSNDILMYDGKVAIINLVDKDNYTGFVLKNNDYYNNSIQLFDLLWRLLPGPEVQLRK